MHTHASRARPERLQQSNFRAPLDHRSRRRSPTASAAASSGRLTSPATEAWRHGSESSFALPPAANHAHVRPFNSWLICKAIVSNVRGERTIGRTSPCVISSGLCRPNASSVLVQCAHVKGEKWGGQKVQKREGYARNMGGEVMRGEDSSPSL